MRKSFVENSNIAFIGVFRSTCIVQKLNTNEERVEHFQNEKSKLAPHQAQYLQQIVNCFSYSGSLYLHWIPIVAFKLMSAYE